MFTEMRTFCVSFLLAFCASFTLVMSWNFFVGTGVVTKDDVVWHVGKSSGDVWVTTPDVQQASLANDTILKPGDNIRTGQTGRALLVRGKESILISPNSIIGIPHEKKDGLPTTIIQQAGSILLEVEKRNVKHFEVETPYLAALVKGTRFQVTIDKNDARVDVFRGQVEVSDFKSGQYALVQPEQAAKVSIQGPGGLSLSGSGTLSPIHQGLPRKSSVDPVSVTKEGLSGDSTPKGRQIRLPSPLGDSESIRASAAGNSADESMWTSNAVTSAKGAGRATVWWNRSGSVGFGLTFPFAIGVAVSIAIAAKRRKQSLGDRQLQRPSP